MQRDTRPSCLLAVCATVGLVVVAHVVRPPASASSSAEDGCFSSFAVGDSDSACITGHGNIGSWTSYGSGTHFETEGYTVCEGNDAGTYYQDLHGVIEFGWGDSVIGQPKGPDTFPLTVRRDTTDGVWRLDQTFARGANQAELKITMQLTNQSGETRAAWILRRADLRMNRSDSSSAVRYDRTVDAVWVRSESGVAAMTLRGVPTSGAYSVHVRAGDLSDGGDCSPGTDPVPGNGFDVFTWVRFAPVAVKPGRSITRTVLYARL